MAASEIGQESLKITVAFADVGKGNLTVKTILVEGIVAAIVADIGEKEIWEMNDSCPAVCMQAGG